MEAYRKQGPRGMIRDMGKFTDHRKAVSAALAREKRTRYWLAGQLKGQLSRSTLYGYLAGEREITTDKQAAINRVMGIQYTTE